MACSEPFIPDQDKDGLQSPNLNATTLADNEDWCPNVPGPAENHGCPFAYEGRDCEPSGAFAWADPRLTASGVRFAAFGYPFDMYCKPINLEAFTQPTNIQSGIPLDGKRGAWTHIEKGTTLPNPVYITVKSCQPSLDAFMIWSVNGGPDRTESLAECLNITPKCNAVAGQPKDCVFWLPQEGLPHRVTVPADYIVRAFWPAMNVRLQHLLTLPDGSYIPTGSYQDPNCQYIGTQGSCQHELIR